MSGEPVDIDCTAYAEPRETSPSASRITTVKARIATVLKKTAAAHTSKNKPTNKFSDLTACGISKKPAASSVMTTQSKGNAQHIANVWKLADATPVETEDDDSDDDVAEVDGVALLEMSFFDDDKSKMYRSNKATFVAMYEDGSLPQWLADAWRTSLTMKKGRTAEQRTLVNEAFDRDKGHLVLSLDKPAFDTIKD